MKIMCLWASYKKKKKFFFAFLKSLKKGAGSGVGSGSGARSIDQRYGYADPDPHQNVTDPQHCLKRCVRSLLICLQVRPCDKNIFTAFLYVISAHCKVGHKPVNLC
jgi:hypothetical protein